MTLIEYIKRLPRGAIGDFASKCGTSGGQIKQVASGHRRAGPSLAISIERETGGLVTCEELRPDVDWAYLRGTAEETA